MIYHIKFLYLLKLEFYKLNKILFYLFNFLKHLTTIILFLFFFFLRKYIISLNFKKIYKFLNDIHKY